MEIKPTPDRIVRDGRIVEFGAFRDPFREVNLDQVRIELSDRTMPGFYTKLRLKEWQHFGFTGEDFYFGFAVVDVKYLGNSFCYFLDRNTGVAVEYDSLAPPGIAQVPRDLWQSECGFRFMGYEIAVKNRLADGSHKARVNIEPKKGQPGIHAELEVLEDLSKIQPLELVNLLEGNRPSYTHKVVCPARGEIEVGGKTYAFGEDTGIGLIDVSKTLPPYNSWWYWATCGGHDEEGRLVALNLGTGINLNEEEVNDNVLWVDGRMSFLGCPEFTFNRDAVLEPWHIETEEKRCAVDFKPEGERYGKVNALVVVSDFHQPYGAYNGTAIDSDGNTHEIRDYFGVAEHHRARY